MKDKTMTIIDILHWIGLGILLFYGIGSLIKPKFVAAALEHGLDSGRGISEFRVLHGGFFLGVTIFALALNHPMVYQALGFGMIGAALSRLLAYLPDKPSRMISLVSFLGEFVVGIFLLV
jgi:hypothetical protein